MPKHTLRRRFGREQDRCSEVRAAVRREEDLPREGCLVGTPEEVAEGLIGLHGEAPYDHLCFWGRLPGIIHEQALANTRLFGSEVVPRVQEAVTE